MPNISEEWFLEELEKEQPDVPALLDSIDVLTVKENKKQARNWAQLMQETFTERGNDNAALQAIESKAKLDGNGKKAREEYKQATTKLLSHDRKKRRLVEDAGFDQDLPPAECIRRLRLLLLLEPGTICYDSTWGQGVVRRVDIFYHRVEIDFERKKDHQLSLKYAAETLDILSPEHLLAILHNDPDRLKKMAGDSPADLVRLTLKSMGPMPADTLKEELVPRVLAENEWKNFWSNARKELKRDDLFELPRKRTEPMRILDSKEELYGTIWFEQLRDLRDMDQIVQRLELCIESIDSPPEDEASVAIVKDRLDFVITGSLKSRPELAVRAALLAHEFQIPSHMELEKVYEHCLQPGNLKKTTDRLSNKYLRPFVEVLLEYDRERASRGLLEQLPHFSLPVLTEVIDLLIQSGYEDAVAEIYREKVNSRQINAKMLLWILRHPAQAESWKLGTKTDLAPLVFRILEMEQTNDDYTDFKRLRNYCEKTDWLQSVMENMNDLQKREFTTRVMQSSAWSSLDRKSMLARIIKIDPAMQDVVTPATDSPADKSSAPGRQTSIRSYHERRRQLENIVNKEIPENSREIAEARSHGDLRENAEFKAAKERQGLLMQKQTELQEQLQTVQPTDFSDADTDKAGPGTMVTIVYPDGRELQYAILGEWDRDEDLNIISSSSELARRLQGHRAGEKVSAPSEHGETEITLKEITGLSPTVKSWIGA